jgi:hypothetical protein
MTDFELVEKGSADHRAGWMDVLGQVSSNQRVEKFEGIKLREISGSG